MLTQAITEFFTINLRYILPALVLLVVLKVAKTPWFKGWFGEFLVNVTAALFLDKSKYHLIKNVTLPTEDGTTQIDHIIVSVYGVFVVETKNIRGWIFGDKNQKTWTQKIFKHSSRFQNPLHQNHKHVKTLETLLDLTDKQVHSLVVFVGDSTFKTAMPENVTYGGGYVKYIKSKKTPVLTESEVVTITSTIGKDRLAPSFKTNKEHVAHVKKIITEKQINKDSAGYKDNINEDMISDIPDCPKCGSPMKLRETKRGENIGQRFYGCTSFPKCRKILNVT